MTEGGVERGTDPVDGRVLCWKAQVKDLPEKVRREASSIERTGTLLYPYWLVDLRVDIKAPLLRPVRRPWQAAVDALQGTAGVPPGPWVLEERSLAPDHWQVEDLPLRVTAPRLSPEDIDHQLLQRTVLPFIARRIRTWLNVTLQPGNARLAYKIMRLFRAEFGSGTRATLALDTLTGEYGVLGSREQRGPAGPEDQPPASTPDRSKEV